MRSRLNECEPNHRLRYGARVSTDNAETESRQQRKERTRQSILNTALELSAREPLAALSLRTISKEVGIVPTAFYRHFSSIEELGLALAKLSVSVIRELLIEVRAEVPSSSDPIKSSIRALLDSYEKQPALYNFLIQERRCGPEPVRAQMSHDLELVTRELATDLARLPQLRVWSTEDLTILADILLAQSLNAIDQTGTGRARSAVEACLEKQGQMLLVGTRNWESA